MHNPFLDPDAIDPPQLFPGRRYAKRQSIFAHIWNNPGVSNRELATAIYGNSEHSRKVVTVHIHALAESLRRRTPWELSVKPMPGLFRGRRPRAYKIIKRTTANARPDLTTSLS